MLTSPLVGPRGPRPTDVNQGVASDCYFLSTLAELCSRDPGLIRRLIKDNGDGTYNVRLYDVPVRGPVPNPLRPVDVAVDARFPTVDGKLVYANQRGGQVLWPLLIEKAYAKLRGGYQAIAGGGKAYFAATTLTGWRDWQSLNPAELSVPKINEAIHAALHRGGSVTATEHHPKGGAHVFSVLHSKTDSAGIHWVQIRNPYGKDGPKADGVRWIRTRDFQKKFGVFETVVPPAEG
jgi:calpain